MDMETTIMPTTYLVIETAYVARILYKLVSQHQPFYKVMTVRMTHSQTITSRHLMESNWMEGQEYITANTTEGKKNKKD